MAAVRSSGLVARTFLVNVGIFVFIKSGSDVAPRRIPKLAPTCSGSEHAPRGGLGRHHYRRREPEPIPTPEPKPISPAPLERSSSHGSLATCTWSASLCFNGFFQSPASRLLRVRRDRPRDCRAAKNCDEFPPPHGAYPKA